MLCFLTEPLACEIHYIALHCIILTGNPLSRQYTPPHITIAIRKVGGSIEPRQLVYEMYLKGAIRLFI